MADLTITAASVVAGSDAVKKSGTAGETLTAGQAVYKRASDGKWLKADNNAATAEARGSGDLGVALNGAANGQPVQVQTGGAITIGATLTAGVAYYVSDTAGGICAVADVGAGEYVVPLGFAKSTTVLNLDPYYTGVSN